MSEKRVKVLGIEMLLMMGLWVVLVAISGCGGTSAKSAANDRAESPSEPMTEAGPKWVELRMDFEVGGRAIPQALVAARVGDAPGVVGWWFVDTGAGAPFVNLDLLPGSGLGSRKQEVTVQDAQNEKKQMIDVVDASLVALGGEQSLALPVLIGIPLPPPFREAKIVGGLNPQMLATEELAIVLDLPRRRMSAMPTAQAHALHKGDRLDDQSTRVCKKSEGGIDSFVFVTDVQIGGHRIPFEIDTGGRLSMFAKDHPASRALFESASEEIEMRGMVGKNVNKLARSVPVRIGDYATTVSEMPVGLGPSPEPDCGFYGLVGADVLGDCLLVLEPDAISISCVPDTGSGQEADNER